MTVADPVGTSWSDLYVEAVARLGSAREARWMIEEVSGRPWVDLGPDRARPADRPDPGARVPDRARRRLATMLERRTAGEPLQYVLGSWAFRRLELMVDSRVLIPRPETEQVVDVALEELDRLTGPRPGAGSRVGDGTAARTSARTAAPPPCAVDLGTGSGAIALSIAGERPGTQVWATDTSAGALDVARANLAGLGGRGAPHVRLAQGSWYAALPDDLRGRVDLIVSNPPYIAAAEMADLDRVVADWEPRGALEAGPTGLEALHAVLSGAPAWLRPGGSVVVEIGERQGGAARGLAGAAGFAWSEVRPDLAGRDRVLVARAARWPGGPVAPVDPAAR